MTDNSTVLISSFHNLIITSRIYSTSARETKLGVCDQTDQNTNGALRCRVRPSYNELVGHDSVMDLMSSV